MLLRLIPLILPLLAVPAGAQQPTPTPTRSPRNLSETAARITLDRSLVESTGSRVVVTNENLDRLAAHGGLTTSSVPTKQHEGPGGPPTGSTEDTSVRRSWRARYGRQARMIRGLEAKAAELRAEIARLDLNDNNGRRQHRLERARQKLAINEAQLRIEERRLHRIVQNARQEGAQPGWFRDLR